MSNDGNYCTLIRQGSDNRQRCPFREPALVRWGIIHG